MLWYLAAAKHRPGWSRVDRLLVEHGMVSGEAGDDADGGVDHGAAEDGHQAECYDRAAGIQAPGRNRKREVTPNRTMSWLDPSDSAADLGVTAEELRVTLHPQSSPHRTRAIAALCDQLNALDTRFPGSGLRLRYAIHTPS
jgi:hypothetical protein